jgi:hypothetical protein
MPSVQTPMLLCANAANAAAAVRSQGSRKRRSTEPAPLQEHQRAYGALLVGAVSSAALDESDASAELARFAAAAAALVRCGDDATAR